MNRTDLRNLRRILDDNVVPVADALRKLVRDETRKLDMKPRLGGDVIEIEIVMVVNGAKRKESVLAEPVGDHFAVRRTDRGDSVLWSVTHRPSGLSVGSEIIGVRTAEAVAHALMEIDGIDWSRETPLEGIEDDLRSRAQSIAGCRSPTDLARLRGQQAPQSSAGG